MKKIIYSEDPKIVGMENTPDRQNINDTTLALYNSRMFKLVNHKKKIKTGILLDEVPTIYLKGIQETIAIARASTSKYSGFKNE